MIIYKYKLHFMEEVFFSSYELDRMFTTEPMIGNYALAYAFGFVRSHYNQTNISYKEDFQKLNDFGVYITPAYIKNPIYKVSTFEGSSEGYYKNKEKAKINYPSIGKIKLLAIGNIAEGLMFISEDIKLKSYIRLGKFLGKVKVSYEKVSYEIGEFDKEIYGLVNAHDLSQEFNVSTFDLHNVHPASILSRLKGNGKMYKIKSEDGVLYYPYQICFGGVNNEES